MDDLNGLSWTPDSSNNANKPPPMSSGLLFPSVRRNDSIPSGRSSTPLSGSSGPSNPPSKSATPANDSFANLVSFGPSNSSNKNLSLIEQQKKLQEERARKEAENRTRYEAQYGSQNSQFWDSLEKGGSKQHAFAGPGPAAQRVQSPDEDDLLAAFNAEAPVDASSHFPVPKPSPSPRTNAPPFQSTSNGAGSMGQGADAFPDDDDPFGLAQLKPKSTPAPQPVQNDDDDFLGLLSKPVSEFARSEPPANPPSASPREEREPSPKPPPKPSNDVDRAVAELVDMGFPADKAAHALSRTASGTDVQAAVGWLLTQAHQESRQKSQGRQTVDDHYADRQERGRERSERPGREVPPWMREERSNASRSRSDQRSPAGKDPAQVASQFGNNFLKTANSLWKTGSKKMQQVVNEFNTEHDPNQPRWLRDAPDHEEPRPQPRSRDHQRPTPQAKPEGFTDEALLLETGAPAPPPSRRSRNPYHQNDEMRAGASSDDFRKQPSPAPERRMQQPAFMQQKVQTRTETRDPRSRVTKTAVEEQTAQAYVSPARRKRPTPQPPAPEPAVDLFDSPAPPPVDRPRPSPSPAKPLPSRSSKPATPLPTRPKAPPRAVPPASSEALTSTHRHREKGADAYKRGDYAAAHESFTAALAMLPDKHPINILILTNRAMTGLKTGEPKSAISDADTALDIIGPSKGESETIDLGNGESAKPMRDSFGKALMRKAEALEQLERWGDAAKVWRQAVEAGHGGSTSIQGRNRCEKAAGISKPAPKPSAPARKPAAPAPKKQSALADLGGSSAPSGNSEAVGRLRAANQAADRADEERVALIEAVDARLAAWKGGKQDNLRALLGSLDNVLWPEAGWKKVNMSELIMPNKVKIQYMKGIGKVHPDKIPSNATTEQRMIASSVFSTLNEAWDKFKKENNL
ncbi:hypothetical protein ASPWEDRAFT_23820 [Aspergillus wentii DTO 134E9]|uniref:UBA domain-containing protein n=1 Tax=Aspergillus wentii DTO 134E9 TaxID=1073089 RepID=A0A1L9S3M5_ASPWE|nr:uncharacterized protein ASPWEDRAFT_23820 [Aspergillus wentii DTO 134E9]KAI9930094.1 hypothetical protein MW887_011904 [Aspergillus wentii]OJJ41758.1 hypothetical protein ASPWEDRAFT_23820 [Aspergillus wentii DTO 134E9]